MSEEHHSSIDIARRNTLKQLSLLAVATAAPGLTWAANNNKTRLFLTLSAELTGLGHALDQSYIQLADDIKKLLLLTHRSGLTDMLNLYEQERSVSNTFYSEYCHIIQSILRAWYISQVTIPVSERNNPDVIRICPNLKPEPVGTNTCLAQFPTQSVSQSSSTLIGQISYNNALVWHFTAGATPSATCGGPFGHWSEKPANSSDQAS